MNYLSLYNNYKKQATLRQLEESAIHFLFLSLFDFNKEELFMALVDINSNVSDINLSKIEKYIDLYFNQSIPVQYILNKAFFYNYSFYVDNRVLIPRSETELIIEFVKSYLSKHNVSHRVKILDLGSGSGCIGIALSKEISNSELTYVDISNDALDVLKINLELSGVKGKIIKSDWLNDVDDKFDIIISNPPYVEKEYQVSDYVKKEPKDAIFSQGIEHYIKIIDNVERVSLNNTLVIFEHGYLQTKIIQNYIFNKLGVLSNTIKDYNNLDRITYFNISENLKSRLYIFPTDTVYGLSSRYDDIRATLEIYSIKKRDLSKPLPVMFDSLETIKTICFVSEKEEKVIKRFLPGPLSIILDLKIPSYFKEKDIAVRIPDSTQTLEILRKIGPMRLTSLNESSKEPLNNDLIIKKEYNTMVGNIYYASNRFSNIPTTIVRIKDTIEILREGTITKEEITRYLNNEY
ncbi:MAG: HemK family protein methyltransferase [Acholeplasmatales bacterium]|jgi:tRNA threonylcarbamoyl adenosine modification protein (Sua5/YciO/YrdC/YwlC family)|nr:HemK family protein methyltransferase [Acholeplasmatales bacterium]